MAFTLRLSPEMHAAAHVRAERIGISVHALVCVALDSYLREPVEVSHPASPEKGPVQGSDSMRVASLGLGAPPPATSPENRAQAPSDGVLTEAEAAAIYDKGVEFGFDTLSVWEKRIYRLYRDEMDRRRKVAAARPVRPR